MLQRALKLWRKTEGNKVNNICYDLSWKMVFSLQICEKKETAFRIFSNANVSQGVWPRATMTLSLTFENRRIYSKCWQWSKRLGRSGSIIDRVLLSSQAVPEVQKTVFKNFIKILFSRSVATVRGRMKIQKTLWTGSQSKKSNFLNSVTSERKLMFRWTTKMVTTLGQKDQDFTAERSWPRLKS